MAIQIRGMGPQGLAVVLGPPLLPLRELLGYVREQVRPARFFSLEPFHGGFVQLLLGKFLEQTSTELQVGHRGKKVRGISSESSLGLVPACFWGGVSRVGAPRGITVGQKRLCT